MSGGVRFAPSPTGRFHLGNLRTAWISREWAKRLGVPWIVRFEDIDRPRVLQGAMESQLEDMKRLGLVPDLVQIQSHFHLRHLVTFLEAMKTGQVYPCFCSRQDVRQALDALASAPHGGQEAVYSGACRMLDPRDRVQDFDLPTVGWRFRVKEGGGRQDFIVARTSPDIEPNGETWELGDEDSFVPAYHWACAVDDWDGDFDLLVRAWDLESSLMPHRHIMEWLKRREGAQRGFPGVFHTSLVVQDDGHRLEKRTRGVTWPELEKAGMTPEALLGIFSQRHAPTFGDFKKGLDFGEAQKTLRLSELLPG